MRLKLLFQSSVFALNMLAMLLLCYVVTYPGSCLEEDEQDSIKMY